MKAAHLLFTESYRGTIVHCCDVNAALVMPSEQCATSHLTEG